MASAALSAVDTVLVWYRSRLVFALGGVHPAGACPDVSRRNQYIAVVTKWREEGTYLFFLLS